MTPILLLALLAALAFIALRWLVSFDWCEATSLNFTLECPMAKIGDTIVGRIALDAA